MIKVFLSLIFLLSIGNSYAESPFRNYTLHFVKQEKTLNEISFQYCKSNYGARTFVKQIIKLNPEVDIDLPLEPGMEIKIPSDERLCPWRSWAWEFAVASKGLKAIDNNGRTANINSSSFFKVQATHEWHWDTKHVSKAGFSLAREDYIESDRKISEPSFFRTRFFGRHDFTPSTRTYSLEAGVFQETVLRDLRSQNLHLSVIPVPFIGHGWEFNVETFRRFRVQFGLMARWLFPAGDSHLNLEAGYEGETYFDIQTASGDYKIFYKYTRQDSNFYKNSSDLLGISYTLRFRGW